MTETALILDRGSPALILGHAAKRRLGALRRLMVANRAAIVARWPDLVATNTPLDRDGARLICGPLTACWAGDEPEPERHPFHIEGVATRAARAAVRRRYDLTEVAVEIPRARIAELTAAADAITAAHIAEGAP